MHRTIWPSLILLPAVLFLLKGCPMCWTMGLVETIVMTVHKRNEHKLSTSGEYGRLKSFRRGETDAGPARLKIEDKFPTIKKAA
jgi:hypothetical protein